MRYLSDSWLEAANTALAELSPIPTAVVIGYVVTGGPEGERCYSLQLGPDTPGVSAGVEHAGVTLRLDWELAVAIAQNQASAQRAFLDGELVLGGDVGLLLGHQKALADFDDRLATLRQKTEFT